MPISQPDAMRIQPGRLLTTDEANEIKAALAIQGETQKSYALKKAVSHYRINKMLVQSEAVTHDYAKLFNGLLRSLRQRVAQAA